MTPAVHLDWIQIRGLARSLNLPGIHEDTLPGGNPCLMAHGRLWTWWDRAQNAPGFRLPDGEREFLIASDPDYTYFYEMRGQILLESGRVQDSLDPSSVSADAASPATDRPAAAFSSAGRTRIFPVCWTRKRRPVPSGDIWSDTGRSIWRFG